MNTGIRFTQNVNDVINVASKIATKYGNFQVGTEHLLYGLTCLKDTVSYRILKSYGVESEAIEEIFDNSFNLTSFFMQSADEFTPRSKEAFIIASNFASEIGHDFVGTEHLLVALVSTPDNYASTILQKAFKVNLQELKNKVMQALKSGADNTNMANNNTQSSAKSTLPQSLLEMGTDLTLKARENKIDRIIGREEEISRVIEILCRKTKNNPVLIGEAGVGKSAIVDGLALMIEKGNVPQQLKNKTIFSLELGGLMAGTKYRGALEEKLKELIDTITTNKNIIVFIDEIHTLMQAGSEKGEINPADMLKPYLARGEFQTIGATTTEEYRKFVEKDRALERRFQPVMVNPPTVEQTIQILEGIKDSYEAFHKVKISHEAIVAAASLSDKYIMDRSLPDKAIDLIDEASSRAKVKSSQTPTDVKELDDQINSLEAEKKEALISENFEKASKVRDKITELNNKRKQITGTDQTKGITITEDDISAIVSSWTGIPVSRITETEREKLQNLESLLHQRVIGQDEAVSAVSKAIRRARIGLKDANRPIGSFMFLGQTGVGKTELCKALAEAMFDNENNVIRLDMSEYMEKHSVSKLIGSPPGYVGFDEGGQLTEAVRRKPYSVVLFDEIEKAHPDVFNMLLQILDDGRLTDSQGRTVSFKNTIIILTSNIGVSELPKNSTGLGFDVSDSKNSSVDYSTIVQTLTNAMKRAFKPEFLNRIDVICVFHPLSYDNIEQIAKIFINKLSQRLSAKGASLKVTESALKYLIEKGYDKEYGARPLRRLIEQEIEDKIAEYMLDGSVKAGSEIVISRSGDTLTVKSN